MNLETNNIITPNLVEKALSYDGYKQLISELLENGNTTGKNQNEELTEFTRLNVHRMKRLEKTVTINNELSKLLRNHKKPLVWLVMAEAWCGDVAQNLPVLGIMAELSPEIDLKILLRDENPEVMSAYLTNGGKAIPKLICLQKDDLSEIGTWGPRPEPAQQMVVEFKQAGEGDYRKFIEKVQLWYAKDQTATIQAEFLKLLEYWSIKK